MHLLFNDSWNSSLHLIFKDKQYGIMDFCFVLKLLAEYVVIYMDNLKA